MSSGNTKRGWKDEEEFDRWCKYFYLNPKPELLPLAIKRESENGTLDDEAARPPLISFYACVLKDNPKHVREWIEELSRADLPLEHRKVVYRALHLSNTPLAKELLNEIRQSLHPAETEEWYFLGELLRMETFALLTMKIEHPTCVDMLWGAFHATGQSKYISRIIDALTMKMPSSIDLIEPYIKEVTRWSLGSQASQHARVLQVCREEQKRRRGKVKQILRSIVKEAENRLKES